MFYSMRLCGCTCSIAFSLRTMMQEVKMTPGGSPSDDDLASSDEEGIEAVYSRASESPKSFAARRAGWVVDRVYLKVRTQTLTLPISITGPQILDLPH